MALASVPVASAAGRQLIGDLVLVGGLRSAARRPWGSCSGRDRSPAPCPAARRPPPSSRSSGSRWRGSRRRPCRPADRCRRRWSGAAQADLLLHGRDGVDGRSASLLPGRPAAGPRSPPTARPCRPWPARRPGRCAARGSASSTVTASPMRTTLAGLVLVGGADVEPQVLDLRHLLPLLLGEQVDRLAGDHAGAPARRSVQTVIRWPMSTCGSQPPIGWT